MFRSIVCVWLLVPALALSAQDVSPPPIPMQADAPYVLHVYANLIQLPTLVLSENLKPLPPLSLSKFALTLDAGAPFRATKMHIEGDEPIALSLLIDASGDQQVPLKHLPEALAALVPDSLHTVDRISVFAFDCKLVRSLSYAAPSAEELNSAVVRVLAAPTLHSHVQRHGCKQLSLLDAVAATAQSLAQQPGRRMMIVLADGHKMDGTLQFAEVNDLVAGQSIAIFGLRDALRYAADRQPAGISSGGGRMSRTPTLASSTLDPEDLYDLLCEQSGGLLTDFSPKELTKQLQRTIALVRGRYILEFPRPNDDKPGKHLIDVVIPGTRAYIRPAGLTLPPPPVPDANTLPQQASPATYGKRHPVQNPQ